MLVAAGVLLNITVGLTISDGERAKVGDPIQFAADDATYTLVLLRGDIANTDDMERAVGNIDCEVTFADGTTATVDGSSQAVAEVTDAGSTIGTFDAVAGAATVLCSSSTPSRLVLDVYAVAQERTTLKYASYGLMAAGLLAGAVAVGLIIIGVRGRTVFDPVTAP